MGRKKVPKKKPPEPENKLELTIKLHKETYDNLITSLKKAERCVRSKIPDEAHNKSRTAEDTLSLLREKIEEGDIEWKE